MLESYETRKLIPRTDVLATAFLEHLCSYALSLCDGLDIDLEVHQQQLSDQLDSFKSSLLKKVEVTTKTKSKRKRVSSSDKVINDRQPLTKTVKLTPRASLDALVAEMQRASQLLNDVPTV